MADASSEGGYGTVAVAATATLIVPDRARRESVIIQNNHATQTLHLGYNSSVTTATGLKLAAGQSVTLETKRQVYGIGSGADTTTNYIEQY